MDIGCPVRYRFRRADEVILLCMEFWHVLNRGIDNRMIVLDDKDRSRFVHSLFELNDVLLADPNHRLKPFDSMRKRETLVTIHAWALLPNHYRLLLSESVDNGLSMFLKKLNMGYAKYFNKRHSRAGSLWQGKPNKIRVKRDEHFLRVPKYIHLAPLDLSLPSWRKGTVVDPKAALEKLSSYRWSSHRDYLGEENFPSIVRLGIVRHSFGARAEYERELRTLLQDPEVAKGSVDFE